MNTQYLARVLTIANVTRITLAFNLRQRIAEKQYDLARCEALLADMPDSVPAFLREKAQDTIAEYTDQLVTLQGALAYAQDNDTSMISASDVALIDSIK